MAAALPARPLILPRLGQTVVMTHQQVALYLLQCIEDYTHHNQEGGSAEKLRKTLVHTGHHCECRHDGHDRQEK